MFLQFLEDEHAKKEFRGDEEERLDLFGVWLYNLETEEIIELADEYKQNENYVQN